MSPITSTIARWHEIEKLNLPGVGLTPTNVRYYPMGSIAAHLLGGMGSEGMGLEGLELKFEKLLAGNGFKTTLKDRATPPDLGRGRDYLPPQHGQHLILTIDANIQMIAEQELAAPAKPSAQARRSGRDGPEDRRRAGAGELADVQPAEPRRLDARPRRNRA